MTSMAKELADMLLDHVNDAMGSGATADDVQWAIEAVAEWLDEYRQMPEEDE